MFRALAPPLRSAFFMFRSAELPWPTLYQDEFEVVSVPARVNEKPALEYALFSTDSCWLIWLLLTAPAVPFLITWKYTGMDVAASADEVEPLSAAERSMPLAARAWANCFSIAAAWAAVSSLASARPLVPRAATASLCVSQARAEDEAAG